MRYRNPHCSNHIANSIACNIMSIAVRISHECYESFSRVFLSSKSLFYGYIRKVTRRYSCTVFILRWTIRLRAKCECHLCVKYRQGGGCYVAEMLQQTVSDLYKLQFLLLLLIILLKCLYLRNCIEEFIV